MKKSKISLILKKAPVPSMMTIISFVLFIVIYLFSILRSVEPYYLLGLIFAVPFVCFGGITYFTVTEKIKNTASYAITSIMIIVLSVGMLFSFIFIAFDSATTTTTDIGKYERVLKLTGYPNNSLIKYFPEKIPDNAKNIVFSYNPAFMQGGERHGLKFETDSDAIEKYINEFSQKAKWIGKSNDSNAEKNRILTGTFNMLGYMELPEDFTIYVIHSEPHQPNNWNHGKLSLIAISKKRNEIIFHAEDW